MNIKRFQKIVGLILVVLALTAAGLFAMAANTGGSVEAKCDTCGVAEHPCMQPDNETRQKWIDRYNADPVLTVSISSLSASSLSAGGTYSLLEYLPYVASERNQDHCGNCWAWAGTGCMEVAHSIENGIDDRLSVQFLNSNYGDTILPSEYYACCGGWLDDVEAFYESAGMFAVPWSNQNADWQDGNTGCGAGISSVNPGSIVTTPHYDITSIETYTIGTQIGSGILAISNIKYALENGNAVWFGFWLANFNNFRNFWNYENETAIFDFDQYNHEEWTAVGGAHAVLCVGYHDDPASNDNDYWIMVNSWGTTSERPNGIFRVDMHIDYDYDYTDIYGTHKGLFWQYLDIDFAGEKVNRPPIARAGDDQTAVQANIYNAANNVKLDGSGSSDPDLDILTYHWTWSGGSATGVSPTVILPLGTTNITLTVSDGDLYDTDDVKVTVVDTLPPSLTQPADVTKEANTTGGYSGDIGMAIASDICDNNVTITNNAPPFFPLGDTNVGWLAKDDSGNEAKAKQEVTVIDTTAPNISAPSDIVAVANNAGGWSGDIGAANASDICDDSVMITNDALAVFPMGDTSVHWTATDDSNNSANATQRITVIVPITIDIKPGTYPNIINLRAKGVVPVAIITTSSFSAASALPGSINFAGARPLRWAMQDVDRDGDRDMILQFSVTDLKLSSSSAEGVLTGKTLSGVPIEGRDSVIVR
jgi:hypothetical protein